MTDNMLRQQILEELDRLTLPQQRQVLHFVRKLPVRRLPGVMSRAELSQFAGAISVEDLDAMAAAIEAGCEQIEPGSWDIEFPE